MESRELFRKNPESTRKLWRGLGFALVAIGIGIGICLASALAEFTTMFPCLFGGMVLTGIAVIIAGGGDACQDRERIRGSGSLEGFQGIPAADR